MMRKGRRRLRWKAWLIASVLCAATVRHSSVAFEKVFLEQAESAMRNALQLHDGVYRVESFEALKELSILVSAKEGSFKGEVWLMCDIRAEGEMKPIGDARHRFEGVFDGRGHVIEGLGIIGSGEFQGLFGYVGNSGCIKNVTIRNARISGGRYVGGIAAYSSGRIENCRVEQAQIIGMRCTDGGAVGSIAGLSCGKIICCTSENVRVEGRESVGGIVGSQHAQEMSLCISSGIVIGYDSPYSCSGGIAGSVQTGAEVKGCISLCDVYAKGGWTGGIAGDVQSGKMLGCMAIGTIHAENAGGVIGCAARRTQIIRCAYIGEMLMSTVNEKCSGAKTLHLDQWNLERRRNWLKRLLEKTDNESAAA